MKTSASPDDLSSLSDVASAVTTGVAFALSLGCLMRAYLSVEEGAGLRAMVLLQSASAAFLGLLWVQYWGYSAGTLVGSTVLGLAFLGLAILVQRYGPEMVRHGAKAVPGSEAGAVSENEAVLASP